ncbi:MAG TPA: methyltransferase domain-containing protein [Chlamydiales bacterium]|nr:methyltransferase domain-containing protein [Chlamydiales bacterium]
MARSSITSKMEFWLYRLSTIFKSFKTLYALRPEQVEAFLNAYVIYDCDWTEKEKLVEKLGLDYEQKIQRKLIDYYAVLNHLCSIGQIEKMYIPPTMDLSCSIISNQKLFEKMMCKDLGLHSGHTVLDIGCGRGRVAGHMAQISGASLIGMNIDADQLESAKKFTSAHKLSEQCQFLEGDLNQLPFPFPDQSFDHIYEIQCVFSLSKNLSRSFQEIFRLLKPGGKFACLEWASLENYDPQNPHHANLMQRIKPLIGAIGTHSVKNCTQFLKEAGFTILKNENASIGGYQAPLIENADRFFTRLTKWIHILVRYKILPMHFKALFDRLTQDGDAFIEADRLRLVTTSHYILAQKANY